MIKTQEPTACADVDPEIFFQMARAFEAKAICEGCWFKDRCRELGKSEDYGMWGGVRSTPSDQRDGEIIRLVRAGRPAEAIGELFELTGRSVRRIAQAKREERLSA